MQVAAPDLLTAGASVRTQIQERVRENYGTADGARVCESCRALCCRPKPDGMPSCRCRRSRPRTRSCSTCSNDTGVLVHPGYFFDFEREAFLVISLLPEPGCLLLRRRRSSARSARADDSAFAPRGNQRAAVFAPLDPELGYRRNRRYSGVCEWLRAANQSVLQILPLNELAPSESSPYSALSAMAIDPQFISIWMMDEAEEFEREWRDEIERVRQTPKVDYKAVRELKSRALRASFERFLKSEWVLDTGRAAAFRAFIADESWWLDEYSVYRALRADVGERPWPEWPAELRDREPSAMAHARERLAARCCFISTCNGSRRGNGRRSGRRPRG